jgi:hypothetical protein
VFLKKREFNSWISDDDNRLPIRIKADLADRINDLDALKD